MFSYCYSANSWITVTELNCISTWSTYDGVLHVCSWSTWQGEKQCIPPHSLNNLFICSNAASQHYGIIDIILTAPCNNCSQIGVVNSIQLSFLNMINGEIMWNLSNRPEEGQIELVHATHSKFPAPKLNHPELHYISNVSTINHPTKAGTQKHSLHQSGLWCSLSLILLLPTSPSQQVELCASPVPFHLHSSLCHVVAQSSPLIRCWGACSS